MKVFKLLLINCVISVFLIIGLYLGIISNAEAYDFEGGQNIAVSSLIGSGKLKNNVPKRKLPKRPTEKLFSWTTQVDINVKEIKDKIKKTKINQNHYFVIFNLNNSKIKQINRHSYELVKDKDNCIILEKQSNKFKINEKSLELTFDNINDFILTLNDGKREIPSGLKQDRELILAKLVFERKILIKKKIKNKKNNSCKKAPEKLFELLKGKVYCDNEDIVKVLKEDKTHKKDAFIILLNLYKKEKDKKNKIVLEQLMKDLRDIIFKSEKSGFFDRLLRFKKLKLNTAEFKYKDFQNLIKKITPEIIEIIVPANIKQRAVLACSKASDNEIEKWISYLNDLINAMNDNSKSNKQIWKALYEDAKLGDKKDWEKNFYVKLSRYNTNYKINKICSTYVTDAVLKRIKSSEQTLAYIQKKENNVNSIKYNDDKLLDFLFQKGTKTREDLLKGLYDKKLTELNVALRLGRMLQDTKNSDNQNKNIIAQSIVAALNNIELINPSEKMTLYDILVFLYAFKDNLKVLEFYNKHVNTVLQQKAYIMLKFDNKKLYEFLNNKNSRYAKEQFKLQKGMTYDYELKDNARFKIGMTLSKTFNDLYKELDKNEMSIDKAGIKALLKKPMFLKVIIYRLQQKQDVLKVISIKELKNQVKELSQQNNELFSKEELDLVSKQKVKIVYRQGEYKTSLHLSKEKLRYDENGDVYTELKGSYYLRLEKQSNNFDIIVVDAKTNDESCKISHIIEKGKIPFQKDKNYDTYKRYGSTTKNLVKVVIDVFSREDLLSNRDDGFISFIQPSLMHAFGITKKNTIHLFSGFLISDINFPKVRAQAVLTLKRQLMYEKNSIAKNIKIMKNKKIIINGQITEEMVKNAETVFVNLSANGLLSKVKFLDKIKDYDKIKAYLEYEAGINMLLLKGLLPNELERFKKCRTAMGNSKLFMNKDIKEANNYFWQVVLEDLKTANLEKYTYELLLAA